MQALVTKKGKRGTRQGFRRRRRLRKRLRRAEVQSSHFHSRGCNKICHNLFLRASFVRCTLPSPCSAVGSLCFCHLVHCDVVVRWAISARKLALNRDQMSPLIRQPLRNSVCERDTFRLALGHISDRLESKRRTTVSSSAVGRLLRVEETPRVRHLRV